MKAAEIIRQDLDAIYIGNLNTVDSDLILPEKGKYGTRFTWESGEERFITPKGKVSRPLYGMGNRKVTLRVVASYMGEEDSKEFVATVLQKTKETVLTFIRPVILSASIGSKPDLPSVVIVGTRDGRTMTIPVTWDNFAPANEETILHVEGKLEGKLEGKTEGKPECKPEAKPEDRPVKALAEIHYKKDLPQTKESGKKGPEKRGDFFPITQVRLKEGTLFYDYQQLMISYLLGIDDDQMLYNFRQIAGLSTKGAAPMTGWDAEECKLKGHTTGHYLSAIALAWAASGKQEFLIKINYMVEELSKCQKALAASGKYAYGFFSAYSEEQFDLLETYTKYPEIWAPYYTLDKIMSGLYDAYMLAGNETAKDMLDKMGDWVYNRLSRLPRQQLHKMWAMYIAGEFGGMLGTMVKVYEVTGKENHLKAARFFENEKLFYPMSENCDTLEDMHANQHIPQIMGAMDLYRATGEETFFEIAKNFWKIVTEGHTYCMGGVGETEMFHRANTSCSYLSDKAAESCASYNMLRLTGQLFAYSLRGDLMDYYDRTLRNHILTSSSHKRDGGTTYFLPLAPGAHKDFFLSENSCCHGTGMESRFRYMEHIYAKSQEALYVNLLIDSILYDKDEKALLEQKSDDGEGLIEVYCHKDLDRNLKIHIPAWGQKNFECFVNGSPLTDTDLEEGYLTIKKIKAGTIIRLKLPMEVRMLNNSSDSKFVNLAYGPYILASLSEETEFLDAPALKEIRSSERNLVFEDAKGRKIIPLPRVDLEAYHVYFLKRKF